MFQVSERSQLGVDNATIHLPNSNSPLVRYTSTQPQRNNQPMLAPLPIICGRAPPAPSRLDHSSHPSKQHIHLHDNLPKNTIEIVAISKPTLKQSTTLAIGLSVGLVVSILAIVEYIFFRALLRRKPERPVHVVRPEQRGQGALPHPLRRAPLRRRFSSDISPTKCFMNLKEVHETLTVSPRDVECGPNPGIFPNAVNPSPAPAILLANGIKAGSLR
jgi:hypothetical protein